MIHRYLLRMVATNHDKTIRTEPYQVGLLPTNAYFCNEQLCSLRTLVGVIINDNVKQGDLKDTINCQEQ